MDVKYSKPKMLTIFKTTRTYRILIFGLLILLLSSCKERRSSEYVLRASHMVNKNYWWYKAFAYFSEKIASSLKRSSTVHLEKEWKGPCSTKLACVAWGIFKEPGYMTSNRLIKHPDHW